MEQAVKNISGGGGRGGRGFDYFSLGEGEELVVRFLTDAPEILTCDFYEYVQTRVKDKEGNWTEGTNSFIVAPDFYKDRDDAPAGLQDWVLKYGGKSKDYKTKELIDPKPKERTVAIAVERERVPVTTEKGGRPKFKHQDKLVEVTYKDKDGNEKTATGRRFILIRKDAKTFWGNVVGYYSEFGTLCDRDYKITRTGTSLATNYPCIPVGPEDEWEDVASGVAELQARYGYHGKDSDGKEIDRDSDERFLYCPSTLDEWAVDQAKEERVKKLLLGERAETASSTPAASQQADSGPPWASGADEAQAAPAGARGDVADLRARLEAHN